MLILPVLVALVATLVGAVPSLEVHGTDLVNPNTGNKFQIVGIAYQPGGSAGYDPKGGKDPLSHADVCLRDAALMQVMGVNTIRVYNVDPNVNHDECVSIFNAAGIYLIIDVNSPLVGEAITSFEPWTSYYMGYLNHTFAVVEAFSNYPNTLLYFSGNEVINNLPSAKEVPPYLRAITRDLKNYIKNNIKRKIPVGYSAADVREVLWDTWNFMQCADDGSPDDMSRADVFALNSYSWCGPDASYESSTFNVLTDRFKKSSVPVFFSEYGCNKPTPRYWNETRAIYGDMTGVFSGGVVYEWTEEENGYGLVKVKGSELSIMGDYNRLKSQLSKIDWKSVQSQSAASDKAAPPPDCESSLILEKGFKSNFTLPAVPPGAQTLIDNGIQPKPSGKIVKVSDYDVQMAVKGVSGLKVIPLKDDEFNWAGKNEADTGSDADQKTDGRDQKTGGKDQGSAQGSDKEDAAVLIRPLLWAAALPLVAMVFFA
ncbi:glucanosyltransferase domain-containing protein [Hirsutella rhossiliensis]|uniref:1,3-beta-glucanosyltransferase n=1 Tax=Hirsutella rhossiliensis TaxID=111463 RepID=A0A9P8SGT5_9HYPO|nr:glucanosyltransferase domain-containing protein [Hirsutella rhossiliensis]KAH0960830.1 glucanosyltransferase domain-containing protein [Hirsutella rhossiliensis]